MGNTPTLLEKPMCRRSFLSTTTRLTAGAAILSTGACGFSDKGSARKVKYLDKSQKWEGTARQPVEVCGPGQDRMLLRDGLVVDGTGRPAYYGDVLIKDGRLETVTPGRIRFEGPAIDCRGKVVAPGFIDAHSHMDLVFPMTSRRELSTPFTEQGVTTFVAGNCGFGMAGYRKNSPHQDMLDTRTHDLYDLAWTRMGEYFDHLEKVGISHNLVNLSGHGTTRTSIKGFDPSPMNADEMKEMLYLLEETMDEGAAGVSLGLQYEPGIFATMDEMKRVAELVRKKDKILTVHMKAYSSLSGTYPLKPFGRPHNLLAIEDMLHLARQTGVRLQLSHLIFVGSRTWKTAGEALDLIDAGIKEGLDIQFDTYAYHCGTSIINVVLPEWFLAKVPEAYEDNWALFRLRMEVLLIKTILGFGYEDIQITDARHPELDRYNGMFISEIAEKRGMSPFENFIDMAKKSGGRARVLNHRYSDMNNIELMMQHPAALFMTDATPALEGVQNPGVYGNFPLFLQYARERRLITLEDCVRKMTGACADRFAIKGRGYLKNGYAADVTVFDYDRVRDNNTVDVTDSKPSGIEHVFINGVHVLKIGQVDGTPSPGRILA